MASKIQFKRGTTTQSNLYRGAEGEVIINTTKDTIVVHDGVQTGGYEIIRSDLSNLSGNVPAVNITDVDCGIYGSGLFTLGAFSSASLSQTLDNPNPYGTSADDQFGMFSIATSGNYAIVGSRNEDDASNPSTGKAYIFNVSTGALVHTLDNPNAHGTGNSDEFGYAVAISGNYAIVGARGESTASVNTYASGKAYIFNVTTGALLHTLDNPNAFGTALEDNFGGAVAMSDDYAIVGAYGEDDSGGLSSGKAYIFNVSTGALVHTLDNPNAASSSYFGFSLAISGNTAIVGAMLANTSSGKAYIYNVTTGALLHTLDNPNPYGTNIGDRFGINVAISGNTAIVGAYLEDDAGGDQSGKAYIYNVTTGALLHTLDNPNAYGTSANDYFGYSVAMSGNTALIGAPQDADAGGTNSGKAYIYNVTTGALLHTLDNPNAYGTSDGDQFGRTVDISDNYIIIGTFGEDDASGTTSGKAYIFELEFEPGNEIDAPGAPTIGTASVGSGKTVSVAYTAPAEDGYATIETYTATSSPGGITGTLSQAGSGTITVTGLAIETAYTFTVTATNSYATGEASAASNTVTIPYTAPVYRLTLNNPNPYGTGKNDNFAISVATSGDYVIAGATGEDEAGGTGSGKAYIYGAASGQLLRTLVNPNSGNVQDDSFGVAVAVSGNYAIVGANNTEDSGGDNSGKAYIYNVTSGALLHTLDNPNSYGDAIYYNRFGGSVAIDGNYAIVGAEGETDAGGQQSGKAYIYNVTSGALLQTLDNPNPYGTSVYDNFGKAVGISGNYALVTALYEDDAGGDSSGKAYIFNVSTGALVHTLDNPSAYGTSAGDRFGNSGAISGNYAIVGAYHEGGAGGLYSGKAYIFNVSTGALAHTLDNPNAGASDYFGFSVAISGNYAFVGAYSVDIAGQVDNGKAYIFSVSTGQLKATLDNPNSSGVTFGAAVAMSDDHFVVGAAYTPGLGENASGQAYVFT